MASDLRPLNVADVMALRQSAEFFHNNDAHGVGKRLNEIADKIEAHLNDKSRG